MLRESVIMVWYGMVWYGMVWYDVVGFNVPLDTLDHFRGRFYGLYDQSNSVQALKDNG